MSHHRRLGRSVARGRRATSKRHGTCVAGCPGDARTLDTLRSGDEVEILSVEDDHARVQTLRFGMGAGSHASCVTRIPAGPIVMRSGRQEIAVGRKLARRIRVRNVGVEGGGRER